MVFILRTGRFMLESLIKGSLGSTVSSHGDCKGATIPNSSDPNTRSLYQESNRVSEFTETQAKGPQI